MSGVRGRAFIIITALFGVFASVSPSEAQVVYLYRAYLQGSEVVPPTPSTGGGYVEAGFQSSLECGAVPDDPLLAYVAYADLMGTPTGCHVHRGEPGVNGPAIYTLFAGFFPSPSHATIPFDQADCMDLEAGNLYVVIETTVFPEGEVRGQLIPDPPFSVDPTTWGRIKSTYD